MNRKELAKEVSEFIENNIGDNDTEDVDLEDAAAEISEYIETLDDEDDAPAGGE